MPQIRIMILWTSSASAWKGAFPFLFRLLLEWNYTSFMGCFFFNHARWSRFSLKVPPPLLFECLWRASELMGPGKVLVDAFYFATFLWIKVSWNGMGLHVAMKMLGPLCVAKCHPAGLPPIFSGAVGIFCSHTFPPFFSLSRGLCTGGVHGWLKLWIRPT